MKSLRYLILAAALVMGYAVAAAAAVPTTCSKKVDSFDFVVDYSGSMMMKNPELKQDKILVAKDILTRINAKIPALDYMGGLQRHPCRTGALEPRRHGERHRQAPQRFHHLRPHDRHGQRL